ncbi:hypothetical protein BDY24DRAFT_383571 [Mrakia frigida]|uniref:uncharacterized protein n=1 Tax=Mrakia frigida TaxID=29902 RepID=UPI003FCC05AE
MLPRSLAGRSLGRISALKGNAPARAYFVQAQHPRLPEDKTPSSSFPRRSSSSSPSSTPPSTLASIPSPGTRPGQPPPAYPSKDKVLIILDHDFFGKENLSPSLLSRALREFGLLYGRAISSTRMYCLPDAKNVVGFVNAAIEIRSFGSVVSGKASAASQMIISDIWTFAIDNPGATIVIFTRELIYSEVLNSVGARGFPVVVVSDLGLAATPLAGAGIFIDVKEFLTRWNVTETSPPSLLSSSPVSKIAKSSSSSSSSTLPVVTPLPPQPIKSKPSKSKKKNPTPADFKAFDSVVDALSNLSKLSHHSSSKAPSDSTHVPDRTIIRSLLLALVPQVLVDSAFKDINLLVETCHQWRFPGQPSPSTSSGSSTIPTEVRSLSEALYRISKGLLVIPQFDHFPVALMVSAYFPEASSSEPGALARAWKDALKKGWLVKEGDGGYVAGLDPRDGMEESVDATVTKGKPAVSSPSLPAPPFRFISSRSSFFPTATSSAETSISTSSTSPAIPKPTGPTPSTPSSKPIALSNLPPIPAEGHSDSHLAFQLRGLMAFLQMSEERPDLLEDDDEAYLGSSSSSPPTPPSTSESSDPSSSSPTPTPTATASTTPPASTPSSTPLDLPKPEEDSTPPTPPSPPPTLPPASKSVVAKKGKLVWD